MAAARAAAGPRRSLACASLRPRPARRRRPAAHGAGVRVRERVADPRARGRARASRREGPRRRPLGRLAALERAEPTWASRLRRPFRGADHEAAAWDRRLPRAPLATRARVRDRRPGRKRCPVLGGRTLYADGEITVLER